ncbi:MAG: phosphatase PAP2 family protein [bacterium]|nr:phosphatase PAP2 family protein [bacterium]
MNSLIFFLAEYAIYLLFMAVPVLWFDGDRKLAWAATLSVGLAWLGGRFIKDFFYFPRPFPLQLLDGSFPSLHAATSFGLSFAVLWSKPRLGKVLLVVSGLIAVGRVATGAHYPIDVIAGALLGYVSARVLRLTNYHS